MRSVVRRVLWCGMFCGGGGWARRAGPVFSTTTLPPGRPRLARSQRS